MDDLELREPVKADAGIRAGYVNRQCGIKVGNIRPCWTIYQTSDVQTIETLLPFRQRDFIKL